MKINLFLGICVIFAANSIPIRAEDNPAQAAARAALIKMLMESNPPAAPAQTNAPAPIILPAPVVPAKPVVPPAPASVPASRKKPASNAGKVQGKSSWDLGDSTFVQTNNGPYNVPAPVLTPVPPAAPVAPAILPAPAPVAAAPVAVNAPPAPAAPVKTQSPPMATPRVVKQPAAPAPVKLNTDIVTIYGTVYKNAQVEKVDPDGLVISYTTPGGGLGMSKVEFKDLPHIYQEIYRK